MFTPRDYQIHAHNPTIEWIMNPDSLGKGGLVIEPTGTGKSAQIAMFVWDIMTRYPTTRIMALAHVKELVEGNYLELKGMWPAAPAGVYAAGLDRKDTNCAVTYAMIQSVAKRPATFGHIDFLLIDEAHRISDNDKATYGKFIKQLRERNPNLIVIGYTATPFRMGTGMLVDGETFDHVIVDYSSGEAFLWFIEQGYLIRPVPKNPGFELDSDKIKLTAGEFNTGETSDALREQNILERGVDLCIQLGTAQNRQAWMHFAQSIEDADTIADMFTHKGYPHESVHSKRGDRDEVLAAFRRGEIQGVVGKEILTTGYNQKNIDLIGMFRLTRSPGLWVQMLGRGTRPVYADGFDLTTAEGRLGAIAASPKQTCLVLDFVGNTKRLGPINHPNVPKRRGKGTGGEMVKECPQCSEMVHISVMVCQGCGYEFPPPERLQADASTEELVTADNPLGLELPKKEVKEYRVDSVHQLICTRNEGKAGKSDTVKATYRSGFRNYNAWICFDHAKNSFPYRKAKEWWNDHGGQKPVPESVEEALDRSGELSAPKFVKVWCNTKFPSIEGYDFIGHRFEPIDLTDPTNPTRKTYEPDPDPMEAAMAADLAQEARVREAFGAGYYEDDDIPF